MAKGSGGGGSGPTVAKAYVAIIPTTKDAQKNISKSLIPEMEAASEDAGKAGGSSLAGSLGSALSAGVSKVATAAKVVAGAGVAALGALTTAAYGAFSDWEQMSGGVQTIFGDAAAETVIANAKRAFGTVQLSANDYLYTVTSFSASLIQSLGGDTDAAASVADKALTDMADNANKMGTSMESLQYAYQGFSRGTFTMLDNLRLGYGGTQEEMLRLVHDAGVVDESITDISQVSFADMIEGIHVIQQNMGIAGASADEAATTLEGSFNMMGASWQNFLAAIGTGSAGDFESAVQDLVDSVVTWLSNALPRVGIILRSIVREIPYVIEIITDRIPEWLAQIGPAAEGALNTVIRDLATTFGIDLDAIMGSSIVSSIMGLTGRIGEAFRSVFGEVDIATLSAAFDALLSAGTYISRLLSDLGAVAIDIVDGIMVPIIQGLWLFVSDHIIPGLSKLGDDLQPLITVTLDFLAKVVEWIRVLADGLITIIKPAIEIVFKILGPVFTKIFEWLGILFKWIGDFLTEVWAEFEPLMSLVIKYAGELFKWLGAQLQEISNKFDIVVRIISTIIRAAGDRARQVVSTVVGTIIGTVSGIVGNIRRIVGNIMAAVWNVLSGIGSAVWSLVNGIYNAASYITNALTSPFIEAFRQIRSLWNNTIGRMSFNIPSWVPGIGGSSFSMPQLANGGTLTSSGTVMVGEAGPEILTLPRGARVTPLSSEDATTGGTTYSVQVGSVDLSDDDQVRRVTREYLEFLARMATPGGLSMSHRSA